MPTLNLYTNVPVDAVTVSDILKDATKAVAKIIGKPESYVMILVNDGVPMAFAGTEAPAAYGELISIGGLGPSVNGKLSSTIAEILQTKLSIDSSRFYIKFYDAQVSMGIDLFGYVASCYLLTGGSAHSLDLMVRHSEWLKLVYFTGKHSKLNPVYTGSKFVFDQLNILYSRFWYKRRLSTF
ncbi:hypothetical protein PTKIN_Ptkin11bG0119100 [Pterospermum kingtungense]